MCVIELTIIRSKFRKIVIKSILCWKTSISPRNYKRVAEIWMDEYKERVYERNPDHWNNIDAGDLSYMMGVKNRLNCQPFKYFLEVVAPDLVERFPPVEPPAFASGGVSWNKNTAWWKIDNSSHSRFKAWRIRTYALTRWAPSAKNQSGFINAKTLWIIPAGVKTIA